jgi:hypothetical protein
VVSAELRAVPIDDATVTKIKGRSLDEHYTAYLKKLASGTDDDEAATNIGFQYQVAKTQQFWARGSAGIAVVSVIVAIAAVVVAAT